VGNGAYLQNNLSCGRFIVPQFITHITYFITYITYYTFITYMQLPRSCEAEMNRERSKTIMPVLEAIWNS